LTPCGNYPGGFLMPRGCLCECWCFTLRKSTANRQKKDSPASCMGVGAKQRTSLNTGFGAQNKIRSDLRSIGALSTLNQHLLVSDWPILLGFRVLNRRFISHKETMLLLLTKSNLLGLSLYSLQNRCSISLNQRLLYYLIDSQILKDLLGGGFYLAYLPMCVRLYPFAGSSVY
jgi:hypothetical protein